MNRPTTTKPRLACPPMDLLTEAERLQFWEQVEADGAVTYRSLYGSILSLVRNSRSAGWTEERLRESVEEASIHSGQSNELQRWSLELSRTFLRIARQVG